MEISPWVWIAWLVAFLGIEGVAIFNKKKGDTLSENVWRWFSVLDKPSLKKTLRVGALGIFMGWLFIHFVSGGDV
jgi:hypothetical protein